jgi:hypothetical protein
MSDNRHLDTPIVPQYPGIPRGPLYPLQPIEEDASTLQPDSPSANRGTTPDTRDKGSTGPH